MDSSSFRTQIASIPDREYLVAELWYLGEMVAEANVEEGTLIFEIYPRENGAAWRIPEEVWRNFAAYSARELLPLLAVAKGDA